MATPREEEASQLLDRKWSCGTLVAGVPLLAHHAMAARENQPNLKEMIDAP